MPPEGRGAGVLDTERGFQERLWLRLAPGAESRPEWGDPLGHFMLSKAGTFHYDETFAKLWPHGVRGGMMGVGGQLPLLEAQPTIEPEPAPVPRPRQQRTSQPVNASHY